MKTVFILIGIFIFIHFTLYYWNIDVFQYFLIHKNKIDEYEINEEESTQLKLYLEESMNELKRFDIEYTKDE